MNKAEQAMEMMKKELENHPSYAHVWHCNLSMCCYDANLHGNGKTQIEIANDAASRFMKLAFGVETKGTLEV